MHFGITGNRGGTATFADAADYQALLDTVAGAHMLW